MRLILDIEKKNFSEKNNLEIKYANIGLNVDFIFKCSCQINKN